jgi:hypothetical protein
MEVSEILKDPNFLSLPSMEQRKVLQTVDPNFAGLPEPEQIKVINTLGGAPQQTPGPIEPQPTASPQPEPSFWERAISSMGAGDTQMGEGGAALNDPQVMKSVSDKFPMAGMMAGGALGSIAGLGPGSIPIGVAGAGVGAGLGTKLKQWAQGQDTVTPESMREVDDEMLTGAAGQLGGAGIGWLIPKIIAPAASGWKEGLKTFVDWAKKNNLPYSADATGTPLGKFMQWSADNLGLGRIFANHQRQELITGANGVANTVITDLGLPPPPTFQGAGEAAISTLKEIKTGKYGPWNDALKKLGSETGEVPLDDTMQYLAGLSAKNAGDKDIQYGIDELAHRIWPGVEKNKPLIAELRRINENGGVIESKNLSDMLKSIWGGDKAYNKLTGPAKDELNKLKSVMFGDLDNISISGSAGSLGSIRRAADSAFGEISNLGREYPLLGRLLAKGSEGKANKLAFETFIEANAKDATMVRDLLIANGRQDAWDAMKAAYLDTVFKKTIKVGDSAGERVFDPGGFVNWYTQHGKNAMELMPEHAQSLTDWFNISKGLMKEYKRTNLDQNLMGIASGSLASSLAGFGSKKWAMTLVPNGFSLIAALGTMGRGNWGFLKPWLEKELIGPYSQGVITGMSQGAKTGVMGLMDALNAKQQSARPLNLGDLQAQFTAQRNQ